MATSLEQIEDLARRATLARVRAAKAFVKALILLAPLAACNTQATQMVFEAEQTCEQVVGATQGPPELLEMLREARVEWAEAGAGMLAGTCVTEITWKDEQALQEECATVGRNTLGCSSTRERWIHLRKDMSQDRLSEVVNHELGHIMHGTKGHLDCPEGHTDLMCDGGGKSAEPTDVDVLWVKGEL